MLFAKTILLLVFRTAIWKQLKLNVSVNKQNCQNYDSRLTKINLINKYYMGCIKIEFEKTYLKKKPALGRL